MFVIIISIFLLIAFIANLIYWVLGLIVMARSSPLWAIGGFLLNPIIQIVFYFTQKDELDADDRTKFLRFFMSYGALFVFAMLLGIAAAMGGGEMAS